MLQPANQKDKAQFNALKNDEIRHGRGEDEAIEVAAEQVKEQRRREGRSKRRGPRRRLE